ncbi:MAG: hypothetical protein FJ005_01945 [Chloroflexi bacterium]|nr:hypothetical protein [Chloroflexota bacterium]
MKSTSNDRGNKKIELGRRTNEGYKYEAKIDLSKDLSSQITRVIKEKEINEIISRKVEELREAIKGFPDKEQSLEYYYQTGRNLLFLDNELFRDIAPYSVFRRIFEELPEILPGLGKRAVATKHLDIMFKLAHIDRNDLSKASWDQWYEIMKFKDIYKRQDLLKQALDYCKSGMSGPRLRKEIQDLMGNSRIISK